MPTTTFIQLLKIKILRNNYNEKKTKKEEKRKILP
jgi:hypothetical protein